ncbi:MAG: hypothetical protein QM571_02480 [Micrococcaceae bacterium]
MHYGEDIVAVLVFIFRLPVIKLFTIDPGSYYHALFIWSYGTDLVTNHN